MPKIPKNIPKSSTTTSETQGTSYSAKMLEDMKMPEMPPEFAGQSLEEIQKAIAWADLQMKMLDLDRIRDDNTKRIAKKDALEKYNQQIQEQIESEQRLIAYAQSVCRHRQGGRASSDGRHVWSGDGKPCVVRTQMLDGVTWLLQCLRCRLKVFTPHLSHYQGRMEEYQRDRAAYDKLWEMSGDSGLDEIRGPTFNFLKDGIPFIPQRQ